MEQVPEHPYPYLPVKKWAHDRMRRLESEFHIQSTPAGAPEGDPYIVAANTAMYELCQDEESGFRDLLHRCLNERILFKLGSFTPSEQANPRTAREAAAYESPSFDANRALRAVQHYLLLHRDDPSLPRYPEDYDTTDPWKRLYTEIASNPTSDIAHVFVEDFIFHGGHANVTERYKAALAMVGLFRKRLPEELVLLDGGCSENLGTTRWITYMDDISQLGGSSLEFEPIELMEAVDVPYQNVTEWHKHERGTQRLNAIIKAGAEVAMSVGIDLEDITDPVTEERNKADSHYPSELLKNKSPNPEELYDLLVVLSKNHPKVHFFKGDLTNLDHERFDNTFDGIKADVGILSTLLYQTPGARSEAVIENMFRHIDEHGMLIILEFAHIDGRNPARLIHEKRWFQKPFPYGGFVIFADDPRRTIYEVLRFNGGRCRKAILGRDAARLGIAEILTARNPTVEPARPR